MGIDSVVNVVVTAATATVSRVGFGTPLLLSSSPRSGTDLVRYYTTPAAVAADYPLTSPEYRFANRMFSQQRRVARVAIGKRTHLPTQSFTLTATIEPNTRYAFRINSGGNNAVVEYTSEAAPTATAVYEGVVAAFNAITPVPLATLTNTGPDTALELTATAAGTFLGVEVLTPDVLSIVQSHDDAGVVDDILAIRAETSDWYGLHTLFPSQAEALAIAEWAEAQPVLVFFYSIDSNMRSAAYDAENPDVTVGGALRARGYTRSPVFYEKATDDFLDGAIASRFLASAPGSSTVNLKQVVGIVPPKLQDFEETNLFSYNVNILSLIAGLNVVQKGTTPSGMFIDRVRDTDWLVARIKEDVFQLLATEEKVAYTDADVGKLTSVVARRAQEAEDVGFLNPGWTITATPVADVPQEQREARNYPAIVLSATTQGAIHSVDPLTITIAI